MLVDTRLCCTLASSCASYCIECAFFSISIPNFAFLPCLAIQVIVSNSNVISIMHNKMDIGEIFEIFELSNPSNITGEENIDGEGLEACSSDYIIV